MLLLHQKNFQGLPIALSYTTYTLAANAVERMKALETGPGFESWIYYLLHVYTTCLTLDRAARWRSG